MMPAGGTAGYHAGRMNIDTAENRRAVGEMQSAHLGSSLPIPATRPNLRGAHKQCPAPKVGVGPYDARHSPPSSAYDQPAD